MKYYWDGNRRFNSWATYAKIKFGSRLQKVSLNTGFSCPNRDGTISIGGCTYCNNQGFNPSYCQPGKSISQQLDQGISFLKKRYKKANKFIAYFQAFTNTYAPIDELEKQYREALSHNEICGISIGTRPDCIDEKILDLLEDISNKHFVSLEFGVESCYDDTLKRINRGHTFAQTRKAIEVSSERNLHITAHLIFGLPGESRQIMLDEADIISDLPINNIKFHQLQIVEGTKMAEEYKMNPEKFDLFEINEYIEFITSFTERLAPWIIIERFCGEVSPKLNIGKSWGNIRYDRILNMIEKNMEIKDTWQGKNFTNNK